jgi:hypothetical protein
MRSVFSWSQTHHLGLLNWPSQLTWSASIPSLSSSRVKCASRPAPKLRTRAGCFLCRKRRKKYDERKSRCSGCASQDFDCVWPAPGNAAAEHGRCRGENAVQRVGQIASQVCPLRHSRMARLNLDSQAVQLMVCRESQHQ